jgi:aminoglycoside phosphotransferase (APT) family kinase protein
VTGVLDWETAGIGHPLKDFDFGEWGFGIFEWETHFDVLRQSLWQGYTEERGGDLPSWRAMHRFYCLAHLPADDDMSEAAQRHRANILDLMRRLDGISPS